MQRMLQAAPSPLPAYDLTWPPLVPARLVRRYKRFLADMTLADGKTITAHCPNSGSMAGCFQLGARAFLVHHDNPRRKLAFSWLLSAMPNSLVGIDTLVPNRLVAAAIAAGRLPELSGYEHLRREAVTSAGCRLDLALERPGTQTCFVEIKNCTLVQERWARFPDAVTQRGQKHLQELMRLSSLGHRCAVLFLVQRMDAERFAPADDIDPTYGRLLRQALAAGVEALAYDVHLDLTGIALRQPLPITV